MKKDYGKIALTPGGLWNVNTPYEKLTTVSRGGQAYLSFEDNKGIDPEQDCDPITGIGTKWFRIATKGDPGTTDYNELINKPFIPTALSELIADALHRTVSDQEKSEWNNKTDKVSNATNGNFAGLDGNGNLTDSGKKASDFATKAQGALADTAYQKPQGGIPASDIAAGVIPDVSSFITSSVNNLVNYYLKSETYTKQEVADLIGAINHFHFEIYPSLADVTTPASNVLYLIGPQGAGTDLYEEYVYPNSTQGFTKIGDTSIDLSNYVTTQALNTALANYTTTTDLNTLLSGKQDTLVSGTNIKSFNDESILGTGNIDFAKYEDTLISSDAITCDTAATIEGVSVYCSNADYYLESGQKIVFDDTFGDNTLYIVNIDNLSNPFIISSGKGSITWNNFTNTYVRVQLASSSNAGQTLSASRYWRGTDNVFIAEYGVTTYQQVLDAYNSGKLVVCSRDGILYTLSRFGQSFFNFSCIVETNVYRIRLNSSDQWYYNLIGVEDTTNKATDFTTLNNTKYPTTQAVADYAQPKIDSTHKLDADLVDDTNSTNKFVTITFRTH